MEAPTATQQANMDLVARAGALMATGFAEPDDELFADDFVWHYVNPHLPELDGDHHGHEGLSQFFKRLVAGGEAGFQVQPKALIPHGDELVVAFVTNTVGLNDSVLDVDAVVLWRAYEGRIHEAWDIPAVNTVRPRPMASRPAARAS